MPAPYLDPHADPVIHLPALGGLPESWHVIDERSVHAVNFALAAGRPLLVRGDPGTGKSQLARAAAERLGRRFLSHAVDGRTETRDLLWTMDAVARLAQAQLVGALRQEAPAEVTRRLDERNFVKPGPIWWAFHWASAVEQAMRAGVRVLEPRKGWEPAHGVVVLIDEIDKADASVPNGLLDALGHGRFEVLGGEYVTMAAGPPPLVVITTNEERALPDAFLRRCIVLPLALSEDPRTLQDELMERGRAHFRNCAEKVLRRAAEIIASDRELFKRHHLTRPGLAEYLDLVRAVLKLHTGAEQQWEHLDTIAAFTRKHPLEPVG